MATDGWKKKSMRERLKPEISIISPTHTNPIHSKRFTVP